MHESIPAFTGQGAIKYAEFSPSSTQWEDIEKPALDPHLTELCVPDAIVLEAGCGEGKVIRHIIENHDVDPGNIVGVDLSEDLLSVAQSKSPGVTFTQGDLESVDLPPEKFDLIVCSMVLEHFDGPKLEAVVKNFNRWLKPNGRLIYLTTHPLKMILGEASKYQDGGWRHSISPWQTPIDLYHRKVQDIINPTINAGFYIEEINEPSFNPVTIRDLQRRNPRRLARHMESGASRLVVRARKLG